MRNRIETLIQNQEIDGKPFTEALHQSLIQHQIITHPEILKCGTYYTKERWDHYRKQCGNIKQCPICRTREIHGLINQFKEEQEQCFMDGGSLYMITGTLRHKNTDSLKFLQSKLEKSIKNLKNQGEWRKLQKQKNIPTRTIFETVYGEENGYHPHVMFMYGTKNPELNKSNIHSSLNRYWFKETAANLHVKEFEDPTDYPLKEKKYDLKSILEKLSEMNEELKDRFDKPTIETMLVCHDYLPEITPPLSLPKTVKVLKELFRNLPYYLIR